MTIDVSFARGTPFARRTEPLNRYAMWLQWYGYLVADVYTSYEAELAAIRETVAMNEMSPLQKYRFQGPDALRFLNYVVTRDLTPLAIDQVFYTPWCDVDGHTISEGLVFRLGPDEYRLSGGRSIAWFSEQARAFDVDVTDETDDLAILALQGPRSREVLTRATGESWDDLGFSRRRVTVIGGVEVDVSRQGFTGELGYELWVRSSDAVAMWDAITLAGSELEIQPAGELAIDIARIEAGLLIPGYDYAMAGPDPGQDGIAVDPEHFATPFELGLGRFVELEKANFVGKEALARNLGSPARALVGLEINWQTIVSSYQAMGCLPPAELRRVAWYPIPLTADKSDVGRASSVAWSPTLRKLIGFGHLPPELTSPSTRVDLQWQDPVLGPDPLDVPATVVPLPFLRHTRS